MCFWITECSLYSLFLVSTEVMYLLTALFDRYMTAWCHVKLQYNFILSAEQFVFWLGIYHHHHPHHPTPKKEKKKKKKREKRKEKRKTFTIKQQ